MKFSFFLVFGVVLSACDTASPVSAAVTVSKPGDLQGDGVNPLLETDTSYLRGPPTILFEALGNLCDGDYVENCEECKGSDCVTGTSKCGQEEKGECVPI
jgi:hypothetical protein